jgi:hypothetical protein
MTYKGYRIEATGKDDYGPLFSVRPFAYGHEMADNLPGKDAARAFIDLVLLHRTRREAGKGDSGP